MLLIIHLLTCGMFILFGVVFLFGKGGSLIAGYNTATPQEKEKYNDKELKKATGKLMFALAGCWLIISLSEIFKNMIFLWVGLGLFMVVIIAGIIYINTSKRVKK